MSVCRVEKNKNYTTMSNYHLQDKRLSLKAKGLLSVVLSLPDNWDYSINGLVAISKENITAIRSALSELKEFGYLEMVKQHIDGRIDWDYNFKEAPTIQQSKIQPIENLHIETLHIENHTQLNTKQSNTNKSSTKENIILAKDINPLETPKEEIKKEKKKKHFDVLADMVDEFTNNQKLREKLKEYLLFRIQRGLKVNQWQIILDDLKKACKDDNERLIDVNGAIAGGYHVIIPPWKLNNNKNNKQSPGGTQRLGLPSIKRMTEEEKKKWREEELIRDKNGNIITF